MGYRVIVTVPSAREVTGGAKDTPDAVRQVSHMLNGALPPGENLYPCESLVAYQNRQKIKTNKRLKHPDPRVGRNLV